MTYCGHRDLADGLPMAVQCLDSAQLLAFLGQKRMILGKSRKKMRLISSKLFQRSFFYAQQMHKYGTSFYASLSVQVLL